MNMKSNEWIPKIWKWMIIMNEYEWNTENMKMNDDNKWIWMEYQSYENGW